MKRDGRLPAPVEKVGARDVLLVEILHVAFDVGLVDAVDAVEPVALDVGLVDAVDAIEPMRLHVGSLFQVLALLICHWRFLLSRFAAKRSLTRQDVRSASNLPSLL